MRHVKQIDCKHKYIWKVQIQMMKKKLKAEDTNTAIWETVCAGEVRHVKHIDCKHKYKWWKKVQDTKDKNTTIWEVRHVNTNRLQTQIHMKSTNTNDEKSTRH